MILALWLHPSMQQRIIGSSDIRFVPEPPLETYHDMFGNQFGRVQMPFGATTFWSDCIVENSGQPDEYNWNARQHEIADLPVEVLTYLVGSRYCESDALTQQAWYLFGATPPGWARAQAISNWVHNHVTFGYHFGRPTKTALDVFREGNGVCRDFSHLFIALCRAMNIPARYASGYLGDIGLQEESVGDFSAWSEVYLEGRWYTFDARYNEPRIGRTLMVRGRDAADVAMMTTFGDYRLAHLKVWTTEVDNAMPQDRFEALLQTRPASDAMTIDQSSGRMNYVIPHNIPGAPAP